MWAVLFVVWSVRLLETGMEGNPLLTGLWAAAALGVVWEAGQIARLGKPFLTLDDQGLRLTGWGGRVSTLAWERARSLSLSRGARPHAAFLGYRRKSGRRTLALFLSDTPQPRELLAAVAAAMPVGEVSLAVGAYLSPPAEEPENPWDLVGGREREED